MREIARALLLVVMDRSELDVVGEILPASLHALVAVDDSIMATPHSPLDDFALLIL